MKQITTLFISLCIVSYSATAQTGKPPVRKGVKPAVATVKPVRTAGIPLGPEKYEYKSPAGRVEISYSKAKTPKDNVRTSTTDVKTAMCLTKEEVRGQKIESEQVIADGSMASALMPGLVIDANELFKAGDFKYIKMDDRKPIHLTTTSNLARSVSETANPGRNGDMEGALRDKVHALTRPSNLTGMPNLRSSSEVSISTLRSTTGLNIGASFFYMGISAENNFKFSSEKYRFMYLYQFEQECLSVLASAIASPADLFKETTPMNNEWLYVREVKYGRRLYVMVESEYDLKKYSDDLNGNLDWAAVSAAYTQKIKGSNFSEKTNISVITQGGTPVAITDKSKVQSELDKYFAAPFREIDIVPLSYKLTYMDGNAVSVTSEAYLDGNHCLDQNKIRVRISKIECVREDDSKSNEEIYGSAGITLFDAAGNPLAANGVTPIPPGGLIPTGTVSYGSKDAPYILNAGKSKEFDFSQQGKYIDVSISNLDMTIQVRPNLHEKDNVLNKDDDFITTDIMRRSVRKMLIEGSTSQVFEFSRKNSLIRVYFEVTPLY